MYCCIQLAFDPESIKKMDKPGPSRSKGTPEVKGNKNYNKNNIYIYLFSVKCDMRFIIYMRDEPIVVHQSDCDEPEPDSNEPKPGSVQQVDASVMNFTGLTDKSIGFNIDDGPPSVTPIDASSEEESREEVTYTVKEEGSSPTSQISSQISSKPSSQKSSKPSSQKSSKPSSQKSSPDKEIHLSTTNFFNKYRVKTLENGQLIVNQNISKYPIDFIFSGTDEAGNLQVQEIENKGDEAPKYNKKTPFIFFAKNNVFDRNVYETKRKTMLERTGKRNWKKVSKAEFRVRLTRYPKCFLLVELSPTREEWFRRNFPHHPKILEFVQVKPLPSGDESGEYESIEEPQNQWEQKQWEQWFEIDDSADFYPETGML